LALCRELDDRPRQPGTPLAGNGGTLARLEKMPDELPAKWANTTFMG
jgi:hypothetical protein